MTVGFDVCIALVCEGRGGFVGLTAANDYQKSENHEKYFVHVEVSLGLGCQKKQ
jgi:hypothetical protein